MNKQFLHLLRTCAAFSLLLASSTAANAETREVTRKSFPMENVCRMTANLDGANVTVTSWDKPEVDVVITRVVRASSEEREKKALRDDRLELGADGDELNLTLKVTDGFWFSHARRDYNVEIKAPAKSVAGIETSGGNISIDGLGDVDVQTSGGDLNLKNISGNVKGRTSGGNIRIDTASGPIDAETSGGNIDLSNVRGTVKASTSGGNVYAQFTASPAGNVTLNTCGGDVSLRLPANSTVHVDASTIGGSVHSEFPIDKVEANGSSGNLKGDINGGGTAVELSTVGGNIHIEKAK